MAKIYVEIKYIDTNNRQKTYGWNGDLPSSVQDITINIDPTKL